MCCYRILSSLYSDSVLFISHSPFVSNTVGRDNYKYFVGLLCVHPVAYLFFAISTVYYWRRVSLSGWFILFLFYSLMMFLMVLGLLNYHCRLLGSNLTTNEDINMTRYSYMKNEFNVLHNPFDKGGFWLNALDGLFPSDKVYFNREEIARDSWRSSHHQGEQHGTSTLEQEGFFEEAKIKLLQ
jgi:hypothetical protein